MFYDLDNDNELQAFYSRSNELKFKKSIVELKQVRKSRTSLANAALHLFCTQIADQFNNLGMTYNYLDPMNDGLIIETTYTMVLVKESIWKPVQFTLYEIESTTELDSDMISTISEAIIKHFGDKGIWLLFPSKYTRWLKELEEKENAINGG